jgi:AcrR family transcriptional regulator
MPVDQRRRQLLDIATRMFVEHGGTNVSTRAVAAEAGVSEGLIYHLFGSKDAIFRQAVLLPLEQLVTRVARLCAELPALDDRTRRDVGVRVHTEILESMFQLTPLLGAALYADQRGVDDSFRSELLALFERAEGVIADGLDGWPHGRVDPALVASVILGSYNWLAIKAALSGQRPDVDATARALAAILVGGVSGVR